MQTLAGKVAVVAGATLGAGRGIACALLIIPQEPVDASDLPPTQGPVLDASLALLIHALTPLSDGRVALAINDPPTK